MDNHQISGILRSNHRTHKSFRGCFPSDCLPSPKSLQYPSALVVNMDARGLEGSHWVALYAKNEREVYYFDSLALPLISPGISSFLHTFPIVKRNSKSYQSIFTKTCAHFCICFIYFMSNGHSFVKFLDIIDTQKTKRRYICCKICK